MDGILITINKKVFEYESRVIGEVKQHTEYIDLHLDVRAQGQSKKLVISQRAPADHNAMLKSESPDYKVHFNGEVVHQANAGQMAAFVQWCIEQSDDVSFEGKRLPVNIADWINAEFNDVEAVAEKDFSERKGSELFCEGP